MRVLVVRILQLVVAFRVAVAPVGVRRPTWQQPPPLQHPRHSAGSAMPDGPPWPELGATPMLAYNGWLASTEFMGYNNETLYYKLVDRLVESGLTAAGYTTIVRPSQSPAAATLPRCAVTLRRTQPVRDCLVGSHLQRLDP
jgi:hypothetical protein